MAQEWNDMLFNFIFLDFAKKKADKCTHFSKQP
jgi:hypothetical protein